MLHMRKHFLGEASDQRKDGGSALVLVVALSERMKRDHHATKSKTKFTKWFEDKSRCRRAWTTTPWPWTLL